MLIMKKGFTLIELLIVIAIIAILATIGFAVYSNAPKGARDAKRKSDVDAIAKALELNKSGDGTYKALTSSNFTSQSLSSDPEGSYTYCVSSSTSSTVISKPTVWNNTPCPTSPSGYNP